MPNVEVLREQHDPPEYAQRLATLAGGLNRSRLAWIGGEFQELTESGRTWKRTVELRLAPKYEPYARWHLERWLPPEAYGSPRVWWLTTMEVYGTGLAAQVVPALGPYPSQGDWEHSLVLDEPCAHCVRLKRADKCEHRKFCQLTCEIAFRAARAIEYSRNLDEQKRRDAIDKREAWEALQDDQAIDEVLGADPAAIPHARRQYLDNVITPQLEKAMVAAAKKRHEGFHPTGYKASIEPNRPFLLKK
jgi:hypothetical protein